MKVEVDLKKCQDHGQCVYAAPDLFALDDDGRLSLRSRATDVYVADVDEDERRGTARGRRGLSAPGHHGARVDGNAACHRWRRATGERPRRQRSGRGPATGVRGGHPCRHPAARSLDAIPASEGHPPVPAPTPPRMLLVLSENWTLTGGRADLPTAVRWAREAEDAGFDAVMVSEHIVLGPDAGAAGVMGNPRDYALPGNQDPYTPWPNSLLLLASIASVTSRLRLAAAAVLAPLRHPLLLARELGTLDLLSEGRLVVQPTVSWSRDEYAALGVPFGKRGRLLDEHLQIWAKAWGPSPVSHDGEHYPFQDVYFEPKAYRPDGPRLWFGGQGMHGPLLRRLVRYGHGFHPLGRPTPEDMQAARGRHGRSRTRHRRPGDDRRHPGRVPRRPLTGRPRHRPCLHSRAAGARLHHLLHQAEPVHRRPQRHRNLLPGRHAARGEGDRVIRRTCRESPVSTV